MRKKKIFFLHEKKIFFLCKKKILFLCAKKIVFLHKKKQEVGKTKASTMKNVVELNEAPAVA